MIRSLFINKEALEKGANRPAVPDQTVKKLGVLGAGMMGAGIALVSAQAGIEVVLLDRDQAAADRGKAYAATSPTRASSAARSPRTKADAMLAASRRPRLRALAGCDLIVEAVFEDPKVKAEVTRGGGRRDGRHDLCHQHLDPADHRSGQGVEEPGRAVHRHPLLQPGGEDDAGRDHQGPQTGDRAVAKALDFVRQIRKTPIVVNDARFFYANRCIIPYINEGIRMVARA